jgi:putative SOS response-associated peptidase YedK
MCVHKAAADAARVAEANKILADYIEADIIPPSENWAWTPDLLDAVVFRDAGRRVLGAGAWGWSVTWQKGRVANTRDDSLFTRPVWKGAAASRCVVAADGFFEWAGVTGNKYEVHFRRQDRAPFYFAGVWRREGNLRSWSMVTTTPNDVVAAVPHDRMPVLLDLEQARTWLSDLPATPEAILPLCRPYPGQLELTAMPPPPKRTAAKAKKKGAEETGGLPLDAG